MVLPYNLNRFGGGKKSRPYYCEVEYLESTGTQYINLNYIPTDTTGYKMGQVIPTSNGRDNIIIGCRQATNSDSRFWQDIDWYSANKTIGWGFGGYSPSGQRYSIVGKAGTYVVASLNYMNDRAGKVDGVSYDTSLESKTLPEISRPMYLFAGNNGGTDGYYVSTKIYFVQITEGNKIVRDFIPVLDWDMKPCMYDRVNNKFYYNAGTGDFTYGREIHYVDWLSYPSNSSVSTHKIPLFYFKDVDKIEYTFLSSSSVNQDIFLGYQGGESGWLGFNGMSNILLRGRVSDQYIDMTITPSNANNTLKGNGEKQTWVFEYDKSDVPDNFTKLASIGGYNPTSFCYTKQIYQIKTYNNGFLTNNFMPAVDEDGVVFMFNKVNHTIYDNVGTGAFSYPYVQSLSAPEPVIYEDIEDEALEEEVLENETL